MKKVILHSIMHSEVGVNDYKSQNIILYGFYKLRLAVFTFCLLMSSCLAGFSSGSQPVVGKPLPAWEPGMLDIHQINMGKGDSGFLIFPDGTTLLLDAGDLHRDRPLNYDSNLVLADSLRAGEWIARYIQAVHPDGWSGELDYAIITHFHGDHMGTVTDDSPLAQSGAYRLAGITDVGERIQIRKMIDRSWPVYPQTQDNITNYKAFLDWQIKQREMQVEQFVAGRNDQIVMTRDRELYPQFEFRNIAVNGLVWSGTADQVRNRFPEHDQPSENNSSTAFRITYGNFSYFNGGDIVGTLSPNTPKWRDMESAVAWVVGPVDAHALNHHGYMDAANEFFLSVLQPQAHILAVYASSHPGPDVMRRMLSEEIYPGPRNIFLTNNVWEGRRPHLVRLFGADETAWLEERIEEAAASWGHIVIRVEDGGKRYRVIALDFNDEDRRVLSVHGPYKARGVGSN